MSTELAEVVGARSLARHGSTFHFAHRLLGAKAGRDVELLYGFCRFVDDLVDDQPAPEARRDLHRVREDVSRGASEDPEVEGFLRVAGEHGLDPRVIHELLAGFEDDLAPSGFAAEGALLRYCYRVAGTVGLMMCSTLDVGRSDGLPFAVDLGIAMQLTNISRDVWEDAGRGRMYLPATLTGGALCPDWLLSGEAAAQRRARAGVDRLLRLAEDYYRSADAGMVYLPLRARAAILVASRCYEAIGPRVAASEPGTIPGRVFVGKGAKLLHAARGLGSLVGGLRSSLAGGAFPVHRSELHAPLTGLPGVRPPCPA